MTNLLKVQTVWTGIEGAPYYTTLHFGAGADDVASQDAVDAVETLWQSLEVIIRSGLTWTVNPEVIVFRDTDGGLVRTDTVTALTGIGDNTGEILPRASSGLVRFSTGVVVGRRFLRGRMFIPLPTETSNDTVGKPTSAYKTSVQSALDALLANGDVALYIWSRTGGTSAPVQSATVWDEWAYLRSRRD